MRRCRLQTLRALEDERGESEIAPMSYGFREKKGMHRDTNIGCTHIESRQGDWQDRGKENEVEEEGTHQRIKCRKQNERSSSKVEPQRADGT